MKVVFNHSPLKTITGIVILVLILALTYPPLFRVALSLPLVLFLPGYMLTVILFPRNSLGIPERLLLSIGSSLGITAVSGLILHWTSLGLRALTLSGILLLWILAEVSILVISHDQWLSQTSMILERNNFSPGEWSSKTNKIFDGRKIEIRQWSLLLLSASFIVIAILIARSPAPQQGLEGYTLLWIQPSGATDTVRIGVTSQEFATTRYQLMVADSNVILRDPVIELEPGETWQKSLRLGNLDLVDKPLIVSLYRLDSPTKSYRRVVFWPETD